MKIRILYTQEAIGSGGVERRRMSLIRLLNKELYEIKVVCTKTFGPLPDEMRAEGVEVIAIGDLLKVWKISKYKATLEVIKKFKPHIIHGAVFEGVLLATVAGRLGRVPIIIAEETSDPTNRSAKATYLLKGLSLLANRFIGVSPAAYNYLLYNAKVNSKKLRLIVNGVALPPVVKDRAVTDIMSDYNIREEDVVLGSVGRFFNQVKLFTDLIDALSILKPRYPFLKLLIVGDGPDKEAAEAYAKSKGVGKQVIFGGYQPNPHPFFKVMDIFALVSSTESFGLAVVEAMFHKLPVVATRVGGLQHIVLDNETGFLVEPKQPEQIAEAVSKLLNNKELIKSMGEKGRVRAEEKYSAERYVKEVEALYVELLLEKGLIKPTTKNTAL